MKKAIAVLSLIIFPVLLISSIQFSYADSDTEQSEIVGIVTDTNGLPLEGVEVTARCESMGSSLYRLVKPNTWTDENGRFNLPVDFPDISYAVTFRYMYNNSLEKKIIPAETGPLNIQLPLRTSKIVRGVVVNGSDSSPVEGATVRYFGEYQRFIIEKKTDDKGQFEITRLPSSQGQSVIYAQKDNQVSPVDIVVRSQKNDPSGTINLKLNSGAELWGTVKLEGTDKPLENCVVSVTTFYMSGYSVEATTDANGIYRFSDLPPGEYKIRTAQNHDYFKYEERFLPLGTRMKLRSGQKYRKDLELKKRMTFEGKVVDLDGKPVAGAIVAIDEAHVSENKYSPFVVHTDEKGKFSITSGRIDIKPKPKVTGLQAIKQFVDGLFTRKRPGEDAIEVFSSKAGYGRFQFTPYREGDVIKRVKIKLNGMIRVHGKVTDPNGNPVKGVRVYDDTGFYAVTETDERGAYDLGKIPIRWPDKKQGTVRFISPRPDTSVLYSYPAEAIRKANAESFTAKTGWFHHNKGNYIIEPGKDIEMNVTIQPADLLTLYGTVSDQNGIPLEHAQITLFGGNADPNTWFSMFELSSSNRGAVVRAPNIQIAGTDENGFWKIYFARETAADMKIYYGMDAKPGLFSIGIYAKDKKRLLIQDINIDENTMEKEINIKLEKEKESSEQTTTNSPRLFR